MGQALDASAPNATGDYATVVTALAQVDASQVPGILTALSGQNYSGFSNSMVQGAQLFMNNFLSQAGGGNRRSGRIALAEACVVACDPAEQKWGAWGGALGGLGTVGQGQALGSGAVTYNVGGFAAGLDRKFTDNFPGRHDRGLHHRQPMGRRASPARASPTPSGRPVRRL